MNDRDLDDEFARIIAGWDAEAPDPLPRRTPTADADATEAPDVPDATGDATTGTASTASTDAPVPTDDVLTDPASNPAPAADPAAPGGSGSPAGAGGSDVLDLPIASTTSHVWRGGPPKRDDADALLDRVGTDEPDDDHFVPPSEIDLPSAETDPMFWAIVGGLVGGPLLLLYVLFFDRDGSGWWVVTALAMIVVGFVLLVLRGGTERDPFDDGTRV
ncbi:hypothetical protein [Intrasporangium sp. YIM S08009]|uniref:hypothetical protein n=1 Tax=Intrasporangium zincisolvens TaxID=3080018 RepID=UPI002B052E45|nr:hypothetical protein [Intrasporangium sp. YIM S08009]